MLTRLFSLLALLLLTACSDDSNDPPTPDGGTPPPTPETVFRIGSTAWGMGANAGSVFYASNTGVYRLDVGATEPTRVYTGFSTFELLVDGSRLFFAPSGRISTSLADGTEYAERLFPVNRGIAADADSVYFGGEDTGSFVVRRLPKTLAGTASTFSFPSEVRKVAVDDTNVYVINGDRNLRKVPKAGGTASVLASGSSLGVGLLATGGFIYFSDSGKIFRVGREGGTPQSIADLPSGSLDVTQFALDGQTLYWVASSSLQAALGRVRLDGSNAQVLLSSTTDRPAMLGVTASHVYYAATENNEYVMRRFAK
jgi:hypothetical protein